MAQPRYLTGVVLMLKLSLLYPIEATSRLAKSFYFVWGFLYVSSFVTTFVQCSVYLYTNPFDLIEEAMIIMNTVIYFSLFVNFTFLLLKRKKLLKLVAEVNGSFVSGTDNRIEDVTMGKACGLSDKIAYFWSANCVLTTLMPTISSLLNGNVNMKTATTDSLTKFRQLPIVEWTPYDPEKSPPLFALTYIWQLFSLANLGLIYAILDVIFPCISIVVGQQFKILSSNFKNGINRALLESGVPPAAVQNTTPDAIETHSDEFKRETSNYFKKNIRHHQTLLKYCEEINDILSTFLMGKISATIFNTLFMAFSLITTGNHAMIFGLATYVINTTIELFIYTYSGQILTESADVLGPLYESRWYLSDQAYRKTFRIVQMRASKMVYTRAGSYFTMSSSTFITFIKALFSYVTLLKQVTDRGR